MTTARLIVTGICLFGAIGLTFLGVFWLGVRTGARAVARELLAQELAAILATEIDDDEGGELVLS